MSVAVCVRCGAFKDGVFKPCGTCRLDPDIDENLPLSFVLTDRFNDRAALEKYSSHIASGITRAALVESLPPEFRAKMFRFSHGYDEGDEPSRSIGAVMDCLPRIAEGRGGALQRAEAHLRKAAGATRPEGDTQDHQPASDNEPLPQPRGAAESQSPMSVAICIKCGAFKCGAFEPCASCGLRPETDGDFAISLAMTDRFNERPALEKFGEHIASGGTRLDLLYSLPPKLTDMVVWSWHHTKRDYERGTAETALAAQAEWRMVEVAPKARSQKSVPLWQDSPHRIKAVEAFDRQPRQSRAEMLAQAARNKATLAKMPNGGR